MLTYHGAGHNYDATLSALNNIEPYKDIATYMDFSYSFDNSIAIPFKNAEYSVLSFENNYPWFFNARKILTKMKFDFHYAFDEMDYPKKYQTLPTVDDYMFDFVKQRLVSKENISFFYFITTMSIHEGFDAVNRIYTNKNYDSLRKNNLQLANYFNSFSYADINLKNFITFIQKNQPNTFIVIYGDHSFVDDVKFKKPVLYKKGKRLEFVPLIILSPIEIDYEKEPNSIAFINDIGATILPLANIPYFHRFRGYNILTKIIRILQFIIMEKN